MRGGGVIAYPTESVWGLGCDPYNRDAVGKLLKLKSRSASKGLILLAADWSQLRFLLDRLDQYQQNQLRETWPGPVTWLVPHFSKVPNWVSGNSKSVALRVSDHCISVAIAKSFGRPIISTSANPQGLPPAKSNLKVRCYFDGLLDAIVPGALGSEAKPTEIRDLLSSRVIRPA